MASLDFRGVVGVSLLFLSFALLSCADGGEAGDGACAATQLRCGESCVNPRFDAENCGACGVACGEGEFCVQGACVAGCESPRALCEGECVDLTSSTDHCGDCGIACGEDEACVESRCEIVCPSGQRGCDGICVDVQTSVLHCGSCGVACGAGQTCESGICTCPGQLEACEGACVDLDSDNDHCGACGEVCAAGQSCEGGVCICPFGATVCGESCTDTRSDLQNCGDCDVLCEGGPNTTASCEGGSCHVECQPGWADCDGDPSNGCEVNVHTDNEHCGGCNSACTGGETIAEAACIAGVCVRSCAAGWETCETGELCSVDLHSDVEHCGRCNESCLYLDNVEVATCEVMQCGVETCVDGWGNCDGDAQNGCETHLKEDVNHCGACNQPCDTLCVDGGCAEIVSLHAGSNFTCALLDKGRVACWGGNSWGQIGIGFSGYPDYSYVMHPALVVGLENVVALSTGNFHSCAVTTEGEVWCWGENKEGRLGNGLTDNSNVPVRAAVPPGAVAVSVNDTASCAGYENGEWYCWGENTSGRLGDGTANATLVPVKSQLSGEQMYLSQNHACVLRNGEVSCVGSQDRGLLGNRQTSGSSLIPVSPHGLETVDALAIGGLFAAHTCVVVDGGFLKCWGSNSSGQIGNGVAGYSEAATSPVLIPEVTDVAEVGTGSAHTCVLTSGGSVYCWGSRYDGKLGDGWTGKNYSPSNPPPAEETRRTHPVKVEGLAKGKQLTVGRQHACLLHEGGAVSCWGYNSSGQLGDGTRDNEGWPVSLRWRE